MNDISNPNYRKLPLRLKEFRNHIKKNQEEFGKLIGMGQAGVSAMENQLSDITMITLYKLVDLGLNPDWLIMGNGPMLYADRDDTTAPTLETRTFGQYTEYIIKVPTI